MTPDGWLTGAAGGTKRGYGPTIRCRSTPIHPHRITESSGESPTNMRGNARMIIICSNLITSATSRTSARSLLSDWRRHAGADDHRRSEEHTSELQSLMRISYADFCLKKKNQ